MGYPIDDKLVVGISTNALFDLRIEHSVFEEKGLDAYKKIQHEKRHAILPKGCAFPFIRRFLKINEIYHEEKPVEVILLSRNNPEISPRVFRSIQEYKLNITRACFTSGDAPYKYIPAFNVSLFLTANAKDAKEAILNKYPAGVILPTIIHDDENDSELRIAFDFDGVIADDEAEKVYKKSNQLDLFHQHEVENVNIPLNPGVLASFFKKISFFQKLESKRLQKNYIKNKILKTAIITARNAPSHERAINTLKSWNVEVDEMFFLGGIEKKRILETLKPHIFFDDQLDHLDTRIKDIPLVHIPFGIANEPKKIKKDN
ncbi:5'-nucleotidase [Ereboglobus sp. PH5-10]|uniref:5'-nucleotidase n=1 Tax=Ereboglobus sp. PH5-10 TaxID=2940629 RepID=UPI00240641CF|nr:5'-nucleotidase [Ereboglobus sp. PH5-10]MDF9827649.1 5'-nucleotidase [Ereboglobus sp. PH5-10]